MEKNNAYNTIAKIWHRIKLLPIMTSFAIVPLIVTGYRYVVDINGQKWFSNTQTSTDLFLYWKGQCLILMCIYMILFSVVVLRGKTRIVNAAKKALVPSTLWVSAYAILATISAIFSAYKESAFFGGYEQWEGLTVIVAYTILFMYTYMIVSTKKAVKLLIYALIIGAFFVSLIGTLQFLHLDLFRSDFGKALMNLTLTPKINFSFNFSEGWVYTTLYNPNYVGSYCALLLPILIVAALAKKKELNQFFSALAMITTLLLVITLLGSQSFTGCIAVAATLLLLIIYFFPVILRKLGAKKLGIFAAITALLCIGIFFIFKEQITFGTDKLLKPKRDFGITKSLLNENGKLKITNMSDQYFYLEIPDDDSHPFIATDSEGKKIRLKKTDDKKLGFRPTYEVFDERFIDYRLTFMYADKDDTYIPAVKITNSSITKSFTVAKDGKEYKYLNAFNKLDTLRKIPAIGFEKNQHFASKRGYIWSRTFPLLKDNLLIGSGPNTFTYVFPNDDYVGKNNLSYDGVTVTKPHNLFLQIFVQTGLPSLVAFLLLFIIYFISSIRLYFNRTCYSFLEKTGVALMFSIFGYIVTGLANDSSVAVAPVYWGMIALGYSVNRIVRKKR